MINWRYVKGFNETGEGDKSLYTFLMFQQEAYDSQSTPQPLAKNHFLNTPEIYINTSNNADNWGECGHIITQKAGNQHIDTAFTFNNTLSVTGSGYKALAFYANSTSGVISCNGTIDFIPTGNCAFWMSPNKALQFNYNESIRFQIDGSGNIGMTSTDYTTVDKLLKTNKIEIISGNDFDGSCHAVYFNATSDKRAKTNLKPLSINAIDLINRVQLYSFKYKDSDLPSIGILAQDVQDVNIEGFDLVDNKQASGVDMDYMSIHESKLTYILWKAIQEQQKEIEELKTQIKNLTK